jgi:hypothetical protein
VSLALPEVKKKTAIKVDHSCQGTAAAQGLAPANVRAKAHLTHFRGKTSIFLDSSNKFFPTPVKIFILGQTNQFQNGKI